MDQHDYEWALFALTIWREASDQTIEAKRAVAWSIRNRVLRPSWWGTTWSEVLTKRLQYSSLTAPSDPNLIRWPLANDTSWLASLDIATEVMQGEGVDCAQGATHYFSGKAVPDWAIRMTFVFQEGAFRFYK